MSFFYFTVLYCLPGKAQPLHQLSWLLTGWYFLAATGKFPVKIPIPTSLEKKSGDCPQCQNLVISSYRSGVPSPPHRLWDGAHACHLLKDLAPLHPPAPPSLVPGALTPLYSDDLFLSPSCLLTVTPGKEKVVSGLCFFTWPPLIDPTCHSKWQNPRNSSSKQSFRSQSVAAIRPLPLNTLRWHDCCADSENSLFLFGDSQRQEKAL